MSLPAPGGGAPGDHGSGRWRGVADEMRNVAGPWPPAAMVKKRGNQWQLKPRRRTRSNRTATGAPRVATPAASRRSRGASSSRPCSPRISPRSTRRSTSSARPRRTTRRSPAASPSRLICEVQQHLGDDRVRAVSATDTTAPVARRGEVVDTGRLITVPVGNVRWGGSSTCSARRSTRATSSTTTSSRWPMGRDAPTVEQLTSISETFETRNQGHRPARASRRRAARLGLFGGAWRRQDRDHPGADQQPRPQEHGGPSAFCGVGERSREGNDLWLEMTESGVIQQERTLVFGQMNEPPGARMRVALDDGGVLPRRRRRQDVLLFIDNIICSSRRARGLPPCSAITTSQVRITSRRWSWRGPAAGADSHCRPARSVTSIQAIYVPVAYGLDRGHQSLLRCRGDLLLETKKLDPKWPGSRPGRACGRAGRRPRSPPGRSGRCCR